MIPKTTRPTVCAVIGMGRWPQVMLTRMHRSLASIGPGHDGRLLLWLKMCGLDRRGAQHEAAANCNPQQDAS